MVYDHDHDDRITRVDVIQDDNIFMLNTKFTKCPSFQSKTVCENIPGAFQSLHLSENNKTSFRFTSNIGNFIFINIGFLHFTNQEYLHFRIS